MSKATKQKLLLDYLFSSPELFVKVNPILHSMYFEPELRTSISFLQSYHDQYKDIPHPDQVYAETNVEINRREIPEKEKEYALKEIETFCKRKAIEKVIYGAPQLIQDENYRTHRTANKRRNSDWIKS